MTDLKKKKVLHKTSVLQPIIQEMNEDDAKRYGYKIEIKRKSINYYRDKDDPYLDIYRYNEEGMRLLKLLCDCLFDMRRAIEIDYNVETSEIKEKESLGDTPKDLAWFNFWSKIDDDLEKLDNLITIFEKRLLENNKNAINVEEHIEYYMGRYNLIYEDNRFMPAGFIEYDPKKEVIMNISPNDLTKKDVKRMLKEIKGTNKSRKK